jgi:hypothetical protein
LDTTQKLFERPIKRDNSHIQARTIPAAKQPTDLVVEWFHWSALPEQCDQTLNHNGICIFPHNVLHATQQQRFFSRSTEMFFFRWEQSLATSD